MRSKRFEDKVDAYTIEKERLYDKYKKTTHELHDVTRELNGLREEFALNNKYTKDLEKRVSHLRILVRALPSFLFLYSLTTRKTKSCVLRSKTTSSSAR